MAKNILKEAIADAKAVREVALANAKAALEEAFTPKLQSMLSAKLSETLNEEEEDLDENMYEDEKETMDEITGMDDEGDMDENYSEGEKEDLDEEIDLEEILNELELEEGKDPKEETVDEAKDKDEETMDEAKDDEEEDKLDEMQVNYSAETANRAGYAADYVHEGKENFDLDALLEEINSLDETEEAEETNEIAVTAAVVAGLGGLIIGGTPVVAAKAAWDMATDSPEKIADLTQRYPKLAKLMNTLGMIGKEATAVRKENFNEGEAQPASEDELAKMEKELSEMMGEDSYQEEIHELKAALEVKTTELNEVNLLNSKLLYVNRIFKANTLDEGQKLRVVETLDKAETAKEAKLIYETIKDTFTVANNKKASFKTKTKSLKEGIGMASRAAGTSTAPKKEVIAGSDNMVNRFQKLANIKINQ